MAFSSALHPDEPIIGDGYSGDATDIPVGKSTGLDLSTRPFGDNAYGTTAQPFPQELIVPQSEWQARIQEREEKGERLQDLVDYKGLPPKDQASTNFCWVNAPTHCTEIVRLRQGEPKVILSPASVGAPVKQYRNQGGWGKEALQYISDHGLCSVGKWPANAINRQYDTAESREERNNYRITEWWELRVQNVVELISALFRGPVAVGLNWWSHEVTYYDPIWLDGTIAIRFRNSWGPSYGVNGYAILQGTKMIPDDAVMARVAIAA